MFVDDPDLLSASLPRFVATAPTTWQTCPDGTFWADLARSMGMPQLRERATVTPVVAFWPHLVLLSHSPRSQYDALRETITARAGVPGNVACLALSGRGFHGQHGRQWSTAPGNLHLSAAIACDLPVREFGPIMPALPAVAVTEAVSLLGQGQLSPGIKWVNDVLLDGRKVAGSLTALRTEGGRITVVMLGVGLNVSAVPVVSGPSIMPTSLHAVLPHEQPTLDLVLATILDALGNWFTRLQESGPADLLAAYREASLVVGQNVTVWPDETVNRDSVERPPLARGKVIGIAPDLGLEMENGGPPITTGRVILDSPGT